MSLSHGNLTENRDLQPLFGRLSYEHNERLLNRLLAVDARLTKLAERATHHVGILYRPLRLDHVLTEDGRSCGIHGGPSGDAGDIWFDISPDRASTAGPETSQWVVDSAIIVFCVDAPERGSANTHRLVTLTQTADSPDKVLDILEDHVSTIETELERHSPDSYTRTRHTEFSRA
jgi:hypothetical protein